VGKCSQQGGGSLFQASAEDFKYGTKHPRLGKEDVVDLPDHAGGRNLRERERGREREGGREGESRVVSHSGAAE